MIRQLFGQRGGSRGQAHGAGQREDEVAMLHGVHSFACEEEEGRCAATPLRWPRPIRRYYALPGRDAMAAGKVPGRLESTARRLARVPRAACWKTWHNVAGCVMTRCLGPTTQSGPGGAAVEGRCSLMVLRGEVCRNLMHVDRRTLLDARLTSARPQRRRARRPATPNRLRPASSKAHDAGSGTALAATVRTPCWTAPNSTVS